MTYLNEPTPVLLIEDDLLHVEQIIVRLGSEYLVEHLTSIDPEKLYNYKAINQHGQIIIVDLVLDTSKEADEHEGLNTIRDTLWPIDRTTFFIVFSAFIEQRTLPSLNKLEPHWTFIKKEKSADTLTDTCLDNLYHVLQSCRDYSSPILDLPQYDSFDWIDHISTYLRLYRPGLTEFHEGVVENIKLSINILNELVRAATYYVKAGQQSHYVAIGIYGSCGRLEMREDSDIECSVYYSDLSSSIPNKSLAVAFWNRITKYMSLQRWEYEGQEKIESSRDKILVSTQADEDLENKFRPVISKEILMNENLNLHPHVRNRHFQILTELRPVFNPEFIYDLKKDLILANVGEVFNLWPVIESDYMMNLIDQFSMDAAPRSLDQWDDVKRFCYRILNVLALKLCLIGQLRFGKTQINGEEDWEAFFELLCDPGIVKVVRFANECKDDTELEENDKSALTNELHTLIELYFSFFARFSSGAESPDKLKKVARTTAGHFITVLNQLRQMKYFKNISEQVTWLFSSERVNELMKRL
jgi:hypothetical protein